MKGLGLLAGVKRALVLAAHTDDEFGCAGTIARLIRGGVDVRYVALSRCEESVPKGFPDDVLETECRAACSELGIKAEHTDIWRFKVRHFPAHRQEILERLYSLNKELSPDLVLAPSLRDMHQDHATVSVEAFRAFKHSTLLGYELPQNLIAFEHAAFIALSEDDFAAKARAVAAYKSQAHRPYAPVEFMRSLAVVRGVQANTGLAEAFEVTRLIID
jgi:LmbE family N-acetylglucosaminyl deacetylase